jgi:hypothetical protein
MIVNGKVLFFVIILSQVLIHNRNEVDDGGKVNWLKIKWLQYTKDDLSKIFFKEHLDDPLFKCISIVPTRTRRTVIKLEQHAVSKKYDASIPIPLLKLADLTSLCTSGAIPSAYHAFYQSLRPGLSEENEEDVIDDD